MNHKWNYQPPTQELIEAAKALGKEIGISPILAKLLLERGITSAADAKRFFHPQLSELHDPFLMKDMNIAVERLNQAMGRKERVLIYGDYDVDGTTAVALVYKFIQQFYSNIDYYIPDRYNEGYGVSVQGIDYAAETDVKLIIVLDCGIKAVNEIAYAKEKGIDFIICDHHVPDDVLPSAVAILNPKRADSTYPYEHLSGCGVGFKFMQAFA
jgi:single-stranded-DNA-specific exonuclease